MKQLVILFTYSYPYSPPTEQFLHKEVEAFAARDDVNLHIVTMGRNVDIKKKNMTPCCEMMIEKFYLNGVPSSLRSCLGYLN